MALNSKIEWTKHTLNLWHGCAKVHEGCDNCYAMGIKEKLWGEDKQRFIPRSKNGGIMKAVELVGNMQRKAASQGEHHTVFVGSMMDIFEISKPTNESYFRDTHNFSGQPFERTTEDIRNGFFKAIHQGAFPNLIFLFLTKRPANIYSLIPKEYRKSLFEKCWFGTSVSSMNTWSLAETLKKVPSENLFLSVEPQIGEIDNVDLTGIKWVIQGGESYKYGNPRPFDLKWAYLLRGLCKEQNVAYFFKQIDKKTPIPEEYMVRELPNFRKSA